MHCVTVKNVATSKRYRVTVPAHATLPKTSDVTVYTLKKNMSPIVKASVEDIEISLEGGQPLTNSSFVPLESTILLRTSNGSLPLTSRHVPFQDSDLSFTDPQLPKRHHTQQESSRDDERRGEDGSSTGELENDDLDAYVQSGRDRSISKPSDPTTYNVHSDIPRNEAPEKVFSRCTELQQQKERLLEELALAEEELAAAQARKAETPHQHQPFVDVESAVLLHMKPSAALLDEERQLTRQLDVLQTVLKDHEESWNTQRQELQSSIQLRKGQRMVSIKEQQQKTKRELDEKLLKLSALSEELAKCDHDLRATDVKADSEKDRVDSATARLDRCKQQLIVLLESFPLPDDPVVTEQDDQLAQYVVSSAMQFQKQAVILQEQRMLNSSLREEYEGVARNRKSLHNMVEDAKGSIRVIVRMRPRVPSDVSQPSHIQHLEDGSIEIDEARHCIVVATPTNGTRLYEFFHVYGPAEDSLAQQGQIFEEQVVPLLNSVFDGYNVSVLAYGATGSGKTFSILGATEDGQLSGLLPQTVEYLLDSIAPKKRASSSNSDASPSPGKLQLHHIASCRMSMIELYMDRLYDLLSVARGGGESLCELRQNQEGVRVVGATEVEIHDWRGAMQVIHEGIRFRRTHKTLKNLESSRSHMMLTLEVCCGRDPNGSVQRSRLVFVDLAGSERISKSLSHGDRLKEAQHINKSLAALGDVVSALSSFPRPPHVPYRNSRLTQLLYDVIGGNSKTLMVTCICPHIPQLHNLVETVSTLKFAGRAKLVRNEIHRSRKN
jgi:hypothetical protein